MAPPATSTGGRLAILISGRGSNMEALIHASLEGRIPAQVAAVIADQPGARGLERARALEVPTAVVDHREAESRQAHEQRLLAVLQGYHVQLVCLAGYMRILSSFFVTAYRGRIMNIHPSLLPSFPGLAAQEQALAHGVKVAGCTVHFVDGQLDQGPIIDQECVRVKENDTVEGLSGRILEKEHLLYPRAVRLFFEGRLRIEGRHTVILPAPAG
ncbi:MAG: phosphoribosylglycinamide formyltransferase [Acidobacteriota bacterium]